MHCGMLTLKRTNTALSEHCHKVECSCSVQIIRKNINNLTASKQATVTLIDLLHLSRNKFIFFLKECLKCRNVTLNLMSHDY